MAAVLIAAYCVFMFTSGAGVASSPAEGELRLGGDTTITGAFEAIGVGEIQLDNTSRLILQADAAQLTVKEHSVSWNVVHTPLGWPMSLGDLGIQTEDHTFEAATFDLLKTHDVFEGLLYVDVDAGPLHASGDAAAVLLVAHHEPLIITEHLPTQSVEDQDPDDDFWFTYRADGDRYLLPVADVAAQGDFGLYLWGSEFTVTTSSGSHTFIAGETRETIAPGYERVEQTYYILSFDEAQVAIQGTATAWFDTPTIALQGTLKSHEATGLISLEGDTHRLDNVPLQATGDLLLKPAPSGKPLPSGNAGTHVGTSKQTAGTYPGNQVSLAGSIASISYAGMPVDDGRSALVPIAATAGTVGLLGALYALTPQGKWLLIGALAPLYAKTQRDRLLESPHRERLMQAIQANPGVHLSRLREIVDISWGTTVYHLQLMEKRGLITSIPRAGQRHFFVKTGGVDAARTRSAVAAIVGQETAHRIAFAVLSRPGSCQKEIADHLSVSRRVVAHHIARLHKAGLVEKKREGGQVRCYPQGALGDALAILDTGQASESAHVAAVHSVETSVEAS